MTAALNLGLLGNNVNSSGQVSLTAGVSGTLPAANGGTGLSSPGANGNVLVSNGTAWTSGSTPYVGMRAQVFTSSGTFTIPASITAVKVTVIGGGGGSGGSATGGCILTIGGSGGGGGTAISYLTGLTPGNTISVTVGAGGTPGGSAPGGGGTGGNSSISSGTQTITTATGNGGVGGNLGNNSIGNAGAGGSASGGTINISGSNGAYGSAYMGAGTSIFGLPPQRENTAANMAGRDGLGFGSGALASLSGGVNQSGGTGAAGVVIFEW